MECLSSRNKPKDLSRLFDHLMSEGKVSMAIRLLSEKSKGGELFRTVREILMEKHPSAVPANPSVLIDSASDTLN